MPTVLELITLGGDENVTHWLYHAKKYNYDLETGKAFPAKKSNENSNSGNDIDTDKNFTPIFLNGGETVALARSDYYIWKSKLIQTYKDTRNGLLGMDYSSKYSPWLALGTCSLLPKKEITFPSNSFS
jgi:deoxyribodipyrimidine photolyase